jgi:hypothetical protein
LAVCGKEKWLSVEMKVRSNISRKSFPMNTMPQGESWVKALLQGMAASRAGFGQERVYVRAALLALAEVLSFGSHHVTDLLRSVGLVEEDWTAWYRLLQKPSRMDEVQLGAALVAQTRERVQAGQPYVVGIDSTSVWRNSQRMEGTSWLKCPRNPPWKVGIHRGQRFLNVSWLAPLERGYSRAIPLPWLPCFPEKAVPTQQPAQLEPQTGATALQWVRERLIEGPFLREKMADTPLMLISVRGQTCSRAERKRRRDSVFYLVKAVPGGDGQWQLLFPLETLLGWAWQRWELEVVHREIKSDFGLGDKQCFNPHAAVTSVQWSAWVYSLLTFTAYQRLGTAAHVKRPTAWQRHPRRWTLHTVLDAFRREFTTHPDFSWLRSASRAVWQKSKRACFLCLRRPFALLFLTF